MQRPRGKKGPEGLHGDPGSGGTLKVGRLSRVCGKLGLILREEHSGAVWAWGHSQATGFDLFPLAGRQGGRWSSESLSDTRSTA